MRTLALASALFLSATAVAIAQPAPAPAPPQPAPEEPPEKVVARALLREGKRLADAGRKREALGLFEKAYQTYPATPILINIGLARKELGDFVESARVFQRFLDDPARDAALVPTAEGALVELDKVLTRVTLDIATTDAVPVEVLLDTGAWEPAPVSRVLRVAPGPHHVKARGGGVTFEAEADLDAVAGVPVVVTLRLVADPPAPPVVEDTPPVVDTPPPVVTDTPTAGPAPVATIAVVSAPPRPPGRFGALVHVAVQTEAKGATGVIGATFTPRDRLTLAIGGMAGGNYAGFATATYAFLPGALRPTATLGAIVSFYHRDPDPAQAGVFGAMDGLDAIYPGLHAAAGAEWVLSRRVSAIAEIALDFYPSVDELPGGEPAIVTLPITPTVGLHARL